MTGELIQGRGFCSLVEGKERTKQIAAGGRDRRRHWRSTPSSSYCGAWRVFRQGRLSPHVSSLRRRSKFCERICVIWERDQRLSVLCMQEVTPATGDRVAETAEGQQVFATRPCQGQRRLAIVVAAAVTPCIISGIFSVKERSCALGFCWEGS